MAFFASRLAISEDRKVGLDFVYLSSQLFFIYCLTAAAKGAGSRLLLQSKVSSDLLVLFLTLNLSKKQKKKGIKLFKKILSERSSLSRSR